jgi:hypothetical protein
MKKYSRPVKIGENKDQNNWRCATCKFINQIELTICHMCNDNKSIY